MVKSREQQRVAKEKGTHWAGRAGGGGAGRPSSAAPSFRCLGPGAPQPGLGAEKPGAPQLSLLLASSESRSLNYG